MQRMKLDSNLILYTKMESKQIKVIKFLQENTWENLRNIGFGNYLLYMAQKAQARNEKLINWTSSKLKFSPYTHQHIFSVLLKMLFFIFQSRRTILY